MRAKLAGGLVLVFCLVGAAWPQGAKSGTAGRGAEGFNPGAMVYEFKGAVTAVNDETREITLTEVKKNPAKAKTFVGVLSTTLKAQTPDGKEFSLKPSDFAVGTIITVFYQSHDRKGEDGKKVKLNMISDFKMEPPPKG